MPPAGGGDAIAFAARAMDAPIAHAGRIRIPDRHDATANRPRGFRQRVAMELTRMARDLS